MHTTVTIKGQVTLPKAVRDVAGVRPGSRVDVANDESGAIVIRVVDQNVDREHRYQDALRRIDSLRDSGEMDMTTDEFMAMIREPLEPFEVEAFAKGQPLV